MAIVIRGGLQGKSIKIHQFCNDWVTDEENHVFSVGNLYFTEDEIDRLKRADSLHQCGFMFDEFEWAGDRLKRKKP